MRKLHYAVGNSNHPAERLGAFYQPAGLLREARSEYWNIFRENLSVMATTIAPTPTGIEILRDHPPVRKITVDISDYSISMESFPSTRWKTGSPIRLHPAWSGRRDIRSLFTPSRLINYHENNPGQIIVLARSSAPFPRAGASQRSAIVSLYVTEKELSLRRRRWYPRLKQNAISDDVLKYLRILMYRLPLVESVACVTRILSVTDVRAASGNRILISRVANEKSKRFRHGSCYPTVNVRPFLTGSERTFQTLPAGRARADFENIVAPQGSACE